MTGGGVAAYELTTSIINNGLTDTAVAVAQGIAGLPADLKSKLNSDDPQVRGEALVDTLAIAGVASALGAKLGQVGYATLVKQAEAKVAQAAEAEAIATARINNNFYAEGAIADPSKAMSATGPWKSVAELSPQEANALIASRIPAGAKVTGTSSADTQNAAAIADNYQAPFVPGTNIVEIVTTQPTNFVRLFANDPGTSRQAGSWVMRAEDIAGLTPQQIASKYSLPQVPTMVTDVTIPAGTRLKVSTANSISPNASKGSLTGDNIGGGGVQFQIQTDGRVLSNWFINGRSLQ